VVALPLDWILAAPACLQPFTTNYLGDTAAVAVLLVNPGDRFLIR
jgi:hypothetical protein